MVKFNYPDSYLYVVCDKSKVTREHCAAHSEDPEFESRELRRSLWRAPELLRQHVPPARGTQKGDVYSFAIVLYEIIGRAGPWGHMELSDAGNNILCTCILV